MRYQLLEDEGRLRLGFRLPREYRNVLAEIRRPQLMEDRYAALRGQYSGGPAEINIDVHVDLSLAEIDRIRNTKPSEREDIFQVIVDCLQNLDGLKYDDL